MNSVTGCMKSKFRSLFSACQSKKIYSAELSTNDKDKRASKPVECHNRSLKKNENLTEEFDKTEGDRKNNTVTNPKARKNDLNIQMLSEKLYLQIFGDNMQQDQVDKLAIEKAKLELKKHGLWKEEVDFLKEVSLNLPPLKGKNIEEHFWNIGKEQSEPYRDLLCSFSQKDIPKPPDKWLNQKGWTKYVDGEEPVSVACPSDDALVFDVEVCVQLGELPTLATAVSSNAWYGWVCSDLADGVDPVPSNFYRTDLLIPFEGKNISKKQSRIIIGHNVSYDRARIKEQYYIKNSALRFLDTMSLHNCIGGISTRQKAKFKKKTDSELDSLQSLSCLSSLSEVYFLYCNQTLDKEQRNIFVTGNMSDIRNDFQNLMTYCAKDVGATYEVFKVIFPVFLERFPHPVTLAGMLEMSTAFLPVNSNWNKFLAEAEQTYDDLNNEIMSLLAKKSDYACKLFHNEKYKDDLWMWDEDWSTQSLKLNQTRRKKPELPKESSTNVKEHETDETEKKLDKKFQYLFDLNDYLPFNSPFLPGYPMWYRNLLEKPNPANLEYWTPCPQLSTSKFITPKLLHLTWENFPLHYIRSFGWGILVADIYVENSETSVPFQKLKELTLKNCNAGVSALDARTTKTPKTLMQKKANSISVLPYYQGTGIWCDHIVDNCCYFFKLPHSQGDLRNVGNPLSREFSHIFFGSFLSSSDAVFEKVVDLENKISYWRNNKERILNQMVVWLTKKEAGLSSDEETLLGVIIPKVVVCGTITRRAMEPTWLTASRVTKNRIGSELRSMVQAPPGYHIIGADVDSQELWIASLIGDSHFAKTHGSTPIGWMTLSGTKSQGTDMHSVTAKAVGISRDHAKIINYARIYGAGVSYAKKLLQNFNPAMKDEEAYSKAKKMYSLTKGKKIYKVKETMLDKFIETFGHSIEVTDVRTATKLARICNEKPENLFGKCIWVNGTESAMFNQLEEIANSAQPRTPFLNCRLSQALEPKHGNNDFFSITRINWVVQSGAVDFLHLMLVCMRWLTNGKARYCFSFHDEVRYLLPSEERYCGALAMHITNLLVRAFCAYRVGIYDLPQSVAFFSSVDVDKTLRKEAHDDCVTPSNLHGLNKKYGIPLGESLNIYEAIEKSKGSLASFNSAKTRNVSSN